MHTLILASASPRRKELLRQIGIDPVIVPSPGEEEAKKGTPDRIVQELAEEKCRGTARFLLEKGQLLKGRFILGADTIVVKEGKILGKPSSEEEAEEMLAYLQNSTHQVYTGVYIMRIAADGVIPESGTNDTRCFSACTKVRIASMDYGQIREYVRTGDPMDKAGAYGIQGIFSRHIPAVEGEYANVVGLPVSAVYQALREMHFYEESDNE